MSKDPNRKANKKASLQRDQPALPKFEASAALAVKRSAQLRTKRGQQGTGPYRTSTPHADVLGGITYKALSESAFNYKIFVDSSGPCALRLVEQQNPKDPLEKFAVMQALWTYARHARLAQLALRQSNISALQVVNEACDRAANTYRRLMLAIAEYRRPLGGESPVAIRQANIAQQQVVQNVEKLAVKKKK